ncbi:cell division protein FtsL [Thiohalomonas denitrificans]|uniref:Cell division protein FtsL n=1 Tax=Thiohalomonas denitrificans TaxID=415747 RepID=A0A1G5PLW6_9GAMM|nr:cell division protein FtsL [Thiohalomonas denitrificans]SCZ50462.1 cell division protein FtsL [Thiohalomonas denitrificans]
MTARLSVLVLAAAVFVSALGVVFSTHEARKHFVALQDLVEVRDQLNVKWGQLQLEQSTWATDGRIERVAREELGMQMPQIGAVVIVEP